MVQRIDTELARLAKLGHTPKSIEVGEDLYEQLQDEKSDLLAASVVGSGETTASFRDAEVTEYKGIRVFRMSNGPNDYLDILC